MKTSSTRKILRQELEERLLSLDEEIAGRQKILSKLEAATSKFEAVLKKADDAAKGYEAQTVQLRETADLEKKLSALQSQIEALEKDLVLARSKAEEQGQIESEIVRLRTEISRQKQDQGSEIDKQAAEIVELETELLSKRTSAEQLKQTVDILSNEQKALLQNIEDLEDKQMSQKKEILEFKDGSSKLLKEKNIELEAASGKLGAMSRKHDELADKLSLMTEETRINTVDAEEVVKTADDDFAKDNNELQNISEEPVLGLNNFAERKLPGTLDKLAKELLEARERLADYKKPKVTLSFLSTYIWDLKQKIISTLKKQKKTRHETAKYIFAIRDIPKYFRIIDEKALLKVLKRRGLQRFIKKVEIVELDDLKDYLVERKIPDLSGLKSIENKQTVYVYPKKTIKRSEESVEEDFDVFIEDIKTFDPSKSENKQLAGEMRIVMAWWATLHDPKKEIKYSEEEIVGVAEKIYDEITKRVDAGNMIYTFHPEKMTRLSCKLYCKVSGEDPKVCVEENAEIFQEPKQSMAIIGSRTTTPEMLEATAYQTKKALAGGWGVVTGGAAGVDAEAIRTALKVLPKPTGGKMAFRVLPVANFLDSKGHVFTSRPYNLPDATVMVEGLGPCRRVKIGKATPELYTRHLSESGFKSITDWQGAKFSPGKEHYIYRVEQLPKNKMLRVYLPKTIKDQPVAVRKLLLEAKTRGFDIVENAGVDRAKTLFKGKPTYGAACYARNKTIIDKSAAVVAVQRGTSKGTSHGIADALERGKAVKRIDENLNTTLMKKEKGKVTIKSLGKLGKGIRALGKLSKVLKVLPAVGFLTDAFDAAILWQELKTLDEAIKTGKATETQKEIWKMLQEQRQAALTEQEWKDIQTILGQPSMPPALKELKVASEDTQNLDKLEVEEIPESQIADVCTSHEDSESVLDTEIMQESPLKLQRLPGIYLVEPHGRFIAIGDKVSIIKSRPFPNMTGKDLYLISDNLCWGIINLKTAEKITQDQFRRRKDSHKISMEEAEEWWDLAGQPKKELYDFRFKVKRIFAPPKPVKIPRGIQTFLKPESISFEKV